MPLIYAFVARLDGTVIAEHSGPKGNMGQVATECLQHVISSADAKTSINCDKHTFNFLKADQWVYLVVADEAFGRQVPYAYLERVQEAWEKGYASKAHRAGAHSFNRSFGPRLKEYMDYLNANPDSVNKVAAVQKRIDDVKSVMVENIEKVLVRGDKLQLLVERTEDLQESAKQFQKQGRHLRQEMWWSNVKAKAAIAGIVLLILAIIVIIACFSGGNRCVPSKKQQ